MPAGASLKVLALGLGPFCRGERRRGRKNCLRLGRSIRRASGTIRYHRGDHLERGNARPARNLAQSRLGDAAGNGAQRWIVLRFQILGDGKHDGMVTMTGRPANTSLWM